MYPASSHILNSLMMTFISLFMYCLLILYPFRLSEDAVNTLLNKLLFDLGTTLVESQPSILQKDTEWNYSLTRYPLLQNRSTVH